MKKNIELEEYLIYKIENLFTKNNYILFTELKMFT